MRIPKGLISILPSLLVVSCSMPNIDDSSTNNNSSENENLVVDNENNNNDNDDSLDDDIDENIIDNTDDVLIGEYGNSSYFTDISRLGEKSKKVMEMSSAVLQNKKTIGNSNNEKKSLKLESNINEFEIDIENAEKVFNKKIKQSNSLYTLSTNLAVVQSDCIAFDSLVSNNEYYHTTGNCNSDVYFGIYVEDNSLFYFDGFFSSDGSYNGIFIDIHSGSDFIQYNGYFIFGNELSLNSCKTQQYFLFMNNESCFENICRYADYTSVCFEEDYHYVDLYDLMNVDIDDTCNKIIEEQIKYFHEVLSKMEPSSISEDEYEKMEDKGGIAFHKNNCTPVYFVSAGYNEEIVGAKPINSFLDVQFIFDYSEWDDEYNNYKGATSNIRDMYLLYNNDREYVLDSWDFFHIGWPESYIDGQYVYENNIEYAPGKSLKCITYIPDNKFIIKFPDTCYAIENLYNSVDGNDYLNHDRLVIIFSYFARPYDDLNNLDSTDVLLALNDITCDPSKDDTIFNEYKQTIRNTINRL